MGAWAFWRKSSWQYIQHWGSYLFLTVIVDLVISFLAAPVFNWLVAEILKLGRIPYVSYTNFLAIVLGHPLVDIGLLIVLLLLLTVVYWQLAFLLFGIQNIQQGRPLTIWQLARTTILSINDARPTTFLFFVGYFIFILPFGSQIYSSPLLSKAKIPAFIVDFLLQKPLYAVALGLLYIIVGYLGIRLLLVLPLMILQGVPTGQAIRQSWQQTRWQTWRYLLKLAVVSLMIALVSICVYSLIFLGQQGLDQTKVAFVGAVVNLFLMEIADTLLLSYGTVIYILISLGGVNNFRDLGTPMDQLQFHEPLKTKLRTRLLITGVVVIFSGLAVTFNVIYLKGLVLQAPITISHRGVDNGNGVQNTIPALAKTSKERPDYIEMDIQETRDHQFVVMHDANLKQLTGVNRAPYQLTLRQLTKLTARENGHAAKVPSFSAYLKAAGQHHQKLLIEIKTNRHDSKNMVALFIKRYEKTILQQHDQIHTLDYQAMRQVKKLAPKIYVSYILPYNLTFPQTDANGYTMELTTLNDRFVDQAQAEHKKVYAWDVDTTDKMDQMMFLGVNGQITDNLSTLQAEVRHNLHHPSYAKRLLMFMSFLDVSGSEQ